MKKKDIYDAVNKQGLISGIYNYCDQWCERCDYKLRCANYSIINEHFEGLEDHDVNNQQFWEKMHSLFSVSLEILNDVAVKEGIDLDSLILEAEGGKKIKRINDFMCLEMSEKYISIAENWFNTNKETFIRKNEELISTEELGISNIGSADEINNINGLVEIIQWYHYQIHVKIKKAASVKLEEDENKNELPRDSDGSAKVALIGIDRSISAWGGLLNLFPEHEDDLLEILVHLEKLRKKTELEFPNARSFIRPGFDEK